MSIYKRQSDDIKTFDSAEEFLKYYENNRKDIDSTHTRSLNLKYKIKDHTIGRKQGKLILYPTKNINENNETSSELTLEQKYNKLKTVVENILQELDEIKQQIAFQNYNHK